MGINGLYEIKAQEQEKLIQLYADAFSSYPKLMNAFPKGETRMAALEATLRFYVAYDMYFGKAYALDAELNEGVCVIHSDKMDCTEEHHRQAGSYSPEYHQAMERLTREERQIRLDLFDELDRLEEGVVVPRPHLYVDFLGVRTSCQKQGRGKKLMSAICDYAQAQRLPLMLFTNTREDVAFYKGLGFHVIDVTASEKFGFTNTYLLKEA